MAGGTLASLAERSEDAVAIAADVEVCSGPVCVRLGDDPWDISQRLAQGRAFSLANPPAPRPNPRFPPCCTSCDQVKHCTASRGEEPYFFKYAYPHMYPAHNRRRVFVEIGANDGIHESNTLYMDRCLGWEGILIEAHPGYMRPMRATRPNVTAVSAAACRQWQRANISQEVSAGMVIGSGTLDAPCIPLGELFETLNYPVIDYFSLDVEGFEDEVLMGIDLNRTQIAFLVIEELTFHEPKNQKVRQILKQNSRLRPAWRHCWKINACDLYLANADFFDVAKIPQFREFYGTQTRVPWKPCTG